MDLFDFINKPEIVHASEADIIREYHRIGDAKAVAKIFNVHANKVKAILKKAGIQEVKKSKKEDELQRIGMSNNDFVEMKR